MSSSIAAREAFDLLNAGTMREYRGWGDTRTGARDRAAREAGISRAQAERLWKNWQKMKSVDGDVYRCLRNTYGHLCSMLENAAERMERERREIEETNEIGKSAPPVLASVEGTARRTAP